MTGLNNTVKHQAMFSKVLMKLKKYRGAATRGWSRKGTLAEVGVSRPPAH